MTATVASTPLIISSILSKKLAEGLDALVMDIKFGSGAFTPGPEEAVRLARDISRVAYTAGLPCNALVTDMDQPLAWTAGNALEVHEAVSFLTGDERHARLATVVEELSAELLLLGGLAAGCATTTGHAQGTSTPARDAGQSASRAQGRPAGLPLGFTKKLSRVTSIDQALTKVRVALKAQGFGIITRIDVQATMKKKLGINMRPYWILGACNPRLAYKALQADQTLGLLLPCNVVVQESDGVVEPVGAKRVAADHLGQGVGLVHRRRRDRPHLVQAHANAPFGELPGGLAPRHAAADH